jgi:hypothetical protein
LRFGTAKAVIVSGAVMIHAATLLGFSQELAATSIVVSSEAIALSEKRNRGPVAKSRGLGFDTLFGQGRAPESNHPIAV